MLLGGDDLRSSAESFGLVTKTVFNKNMQSSTNFDDLNGSSINSLDIKQLKEIVIVTTPGRSPTRSDSKSLRDEKQGGNNPFVLNGTKDTTLFVKDAGNTMQITFQNSSTDGNWEEKSMRKFDPEILVEPS